MGWHLRAEIRGFQGPRADKLGLVPYAGDSRNGTALGPSRGCGNSYVSLFSPVIWPEQAKKWYELYEKNFWQQGKVMAGFREFPKQMTGKDWYADVDSGPVIGGIGFAASAFGVGAARVNGRFDHAYPLTAEMYVTSWPLPNGTLALPRLLSNAADAPYLGEAAILFVLTRSPEKGFDIKTGGSIPALVILIIAGQLLIGLASISRCIVSLRLWLRSQADMVVLKPQVQFIVWLALLASEDAPAKKYRLADLIDACRAYPLRSTERITFEYVLLDGVNDTWGRGCRHHGLAG